MKTERCTKHPVTFAGARGDTLFGLVCDPATATPRQTGIIICVDGIKQRFGSGGINAHLAERLAHLGYPVLSFDPAGVGDSQGQLQDKSLQEHYRDIQGGAFVPDTVAAADFFRQARPIQDLCFLGLCGGGVTALSAAAEVPQCRAALIMGLPALLEKTGPPSTQAPPQARRPSDTEMARQLKNARSRLLQRGFYRDLLRKPGYYLRKVGLLLESRLRGSLARFGSPPAPLGSAEDLHERMNPVVFKGLEHLVDVDLKVALIFAELDSVTWEFESEYWAPYGKGRFRKASGLVYEVVPQANHVFTTPASRDDLWSVLEKFLTTHV